MLIEERREHPRVRVNECLDALHRLVDPYVMNVSRTGMFIRTAFPLEPGGRITLDYPVVGRDGMPIEGIGRIVRLSRRPQGMGVEFTRLTDESRRFIEALVTNEDEETGSPLPT